MVIVYILWSHISIGDEQYDTKLIINKQSLPVHSMSMKPVWVWQWDPVSF